MRNWINKVKNFEQFINEGIFNKKPTDIEIKKRLEQWFKGGFDSESNLNNDWIIKNNKYLKKGDGGLFYRHITINDVEYNLLKNGGNISIDELKTSSWCRNIENLIKYLKQEYGLNEIFGGFRTKSIIFSKTINKNDILCDIGETLNEDIDEIIVNAKIRNISTSDIIHFYEINKEFKNSYMKEIF